MFFCGPRPMPGALTGLLCISLLGGSQALAQAPATNPVAPYGTIEGEWRDPSPGGYSILVRKMGRGFDVQWVGQSLAYTLLEATAEDFELQIDQGLQQTFMRCGLTNAGSELLCRSRFVQEGRNAGMSDPFTYNRVR